MPLRGAASCLIAFLLENGGFFTPPGRAKERPVHRDANT